MNTETLGDAAGQIHLSSANNFGRNVAVKTCQLSPSVR